MPFNGSGVFTRLENWSSDAASNLPISATKFDIEDNDFAGGFDLCLTRDGQGAPSAPLTWPVLLTLTRGSDGQILGLARTGGANNPALQFNVADVGGFTINTSIATAVAIAIAGTAALTIASTRAATFNGAVSVVPTSGNASLTLNGSGSFSSILTMNAAGGGTSLINSVGGTLQLGQSGTVYWSLGTNGGMSNAAPSSGVSLTVNGLTAASPFVQFNSGSTSANAAADVEISRPSTTANAFVKGANLYLADSGGGTSTCIQHAGGQTEIYQGGVEVAFWNTNRALNLAATASGSVLTINTASSLDGLDISAASATSATMGLLIGGAAKAFLGVAGSANQIVAGSALGDLVLRVESGNLLLGANGNTGFAVKLNSSGNVTIAAPSSGAALSTSGGPITSNPASDSAAFNATGTGTGTAFFNSNPTNPTIGWSTGGLQTGSAVEVLTANKPGSTTGIVGWLSVNNNGSQGWMPVWGN